MDLKGKTAIVTGGGRDIGRACVLELAARGANVAINYMASSEGADSAVAEIKAAGGKAFALQGDMTKEADVAALVEKTVEEFGQVDTLVHVTGGLVARVTMSEMTLDHWQSVMDVNLTSFVLMVRECLPHMTEGSSIVAGRSRWRRARCLGLRRIKGGADDADAGSGERAGSENPREFALPGDDRYRFPQHLYQTRSAHPCGQCLARETRGDFGRCGQAGGVPCLG